MAPNADATLDEVYRSDWGWIVAKLIRHFGDFDLAEEAAQEAFATAIDQWRESGIPDSPRAWIVQAARNKAIDRIRRNVNFQEKIRANAPSELSFSEPRLESEEISDDRLRLIFTCCHPALAHESQVALTLRMLGGLETEE